MKTTIGGLVKMKRNSRAKAKGPMAKITTDNNHSKKPPLRMGVTIPRKEGKMSSQSACEGKPIKGLKTDNPVNGEKGTTYGNA